MKKITIILFTITFVLGCSTSSDSNGNSNTTVVPLAPSNLTGQAVSGTQINLSWTDNSTNETEFVIERKTGSGAFTVIGTTTTNVVSFNDTGLNQDTNYTYRLYSKNSAGNSLNYSNEITVLTLSASITDIDGNTYPVVYIGNQIWTKSNLNVSRYRNGDVIPQVTDPTQWNSLTSGAWCYYNNDPANGLIYGKLYNWYAVNDPRGLAPVGYHIPSTNEWDILKASVGGDGGKLKEIGTTYWLAPNAGATNSSGFTGLPGGRLGAYINEIGKWWSTTQSPNNPNFIQTPQLNFNDTGFNTNTVAFRFFGCSVRCVKD